MKILITGGAGFIGSHLVEHFQDHAEVRVLDNLRSGCRHNLNGLPHEFMEGTISDRELVRQAVTGVDYVFHLAAMVSVPESLTNPILCNEINVNGTLIVLEEAARANVKKLVFSSSAAIYGDNPAVPKLETMLPEPKSPYAITKLAGEFYCQRFSDEGRLATACLRYFNVFGPRQNPSSQHAAAVPIFIARALQNLPIMIYGDGEQTRDFISVKDVVAANVFFGTKSNAVGVFNVACGETITIKQLAQKIISATGSTSEIRHLPERSGDVKHSLAAIDHSLKAGFRPAKSFDLALKMTVRNLAVKSAR